MGVLVPLWSDYPATTVNFVLRIIAVLSALCALILTCFSRWKTWKDKNDWVTWIFLPFLVVAYGVYAAASAAYWAVLLSGLKIAGAGIFTISVFINIGEFVFELALFIAVPRIIGQQIRKAKGKEPGRVFRVLAVLFLIILVPLDGVRLFIHLFLDEVSDVQQELSAYVGIVANGHQENEANNFLTQATPDGLEDAWGDLISTAYKAQFAFYILWLIYNIVLIGFASLLAKNRRPELPDKLILYAILPLILLYNVVYSIYYGQTAFHEAQSYGLFNAAQIVDSIVFSIVLICLSLVGYIGRSRSRQADSPSEKQTGQNPYASQSMPSGWAGDTNEPAYSPSQPPRYTSPTQAPSSPPQKYPTSVTTYSNSVQPYSNSMQPNLSPLQTYPTSVQSNPSHTQTHASSNRAYSSVDREYRVGQAYAIQPLEIPRRPVPSASPPSNSPPQPQGMASNWLNSQPGRISPMVGDRSVSPQMQDHDTTWAYNQVKRTPATSSSQSPPPNQTQNPQAYEIQSVEITRHPGTSASPPLDHPPQTQTQEQTWVYSQAQRTSPTSGGQSPPPQQAQNSQTTWEYSRTGGTSVTSSDQSPPAQQTYNSQATWEYSRTGRTSAMSGEGSPPSQQAPSLDRGWAYTPSVSTMESPSGPSRSPQAKPFNAFR